GAQYQVNDRPDASIWAIGAKPGFASRQKVSLAQMPLSSGPDGVLDDQYLAFRQYIHAFLIPLALAVLGSSLLILFGLPYLMVVAIARPLKRLLGGVEQFDRDQKHRYIPVEYNDEIGYLTTAFNKMSSALDDLVCNLEMRVNERTADLLAVNEKLHKLSVAVEKSPSVIMITDPQFEIEYVNEAFTLTTGYTFDEVKGKNPLFLRSDQTSPENFEKMWVTLREGKTWRGELANQRKNGEIYWEFTVIAPIYDVEGNVTHYVAVNEDITARKAAEQKLEQMAITDPLTGLLNRRGFFQKAQKVYARSKHLPYTMGVLMIDIDHFKLINDRYGHQAGDSVLGEISTRMRDNLRSIDIVARYGGEEFVVLLPRTQLDTLRQISSRLNLVVSDQPVIYKGFSIPVTISIGGTMITAETRSLDDLLVQADQAMYQAKAKGRNCFVMWQIESE
ncbi:MAG: diguanylate cyclase, partial [Anaerolineales bacterium]|nr:diguanylate cyclase [Anaerolineales bacterium]